MLGRLGLCYDGRVWGEGFQIGPPTVLQLRAGFHRKYDVNMTKQKPRSDGSRTNRDGMGDLLTKVKRPFPHPPTLNFRSAFIQDGWANPENQSHNHRSSAGKAW